MEFTSSIRHRSSALRAALGMVKPTVAFRWALIVLGLIELVYFYNALTGDWFYSGNDMLFIAPQLRHAGAADAWSWVNGPWVGYSLFNYYRPTTSLLMFAEYRMFGENAFNWEAVSLAVHIASTMMLADLLRRLFKDPLAALVGAAIWGFHSRLDLAIAWTPAQTDFFAGFFVILALLCFQRMLEGKSKAFGFAGVAAAILAMGAKEVALTLPALATLLVLRFEGLSVKDRVGLICGAWLVGAAFFVWRTYALGGVGYVPAMMHSVGPLYYLHSGAAFMLPPTLGPDSLSDPVAIWIAGIGLVAGVAMAAQKRGLWYLPAFAGLIVATLMIGPLDWTLPTTYESFATGVVWVGLLALALRYRPVDSALCIAWGVCALLPVLKIVFNSAGNVNYVPWTYWALVWTWIAAACLQAIRGSFGKKTTPQATS